MDKQHLISINKAIENSLTLEEYFIIYALFHNAEDILIAYTKKNKINTVIFENLKLKGYINYKDEHKNELYFELLSLTDFGLLVFNNPLDKSEYNFESFRKIYPTKVTDNFIVRRLHGNLAKCKKLYEKLLLETTDYNLSRCLKLYVDEQLKNNNGIYMKNLETWLSQKLYKNYIDDLENENIKNQNQSEDI